MLIRVNNVIGKSRTKQQLFTQTFPVIFFDKTTVLFAISPDMEDIWNAYF